MKRSILTIILLLLMGGTALAGVCEDWNELDRLVRDNRIARQEARTIVAALHSRLLESYVGQAWGRETAYPLRAYGAKSIGGRNGNGYKPAGYNFYDGNRHGGHPAQDLFVNDRNQDSLDDRTGKPVEVLAFTGGVVVAVHVGWEYPNGIRGGNYVWIFNPAEETYQYYAHLAGITVKPGDIVTAGTTIGTLGRSGKNAFRKRSPTHLHFMILTYDNGRMTPGNPYRRLISAPAGDKP